MEVEEVVNDEKEAEENLQSNKLVKRHALESGFTLLLRFFWPCGARLFPY